MSRQSPVASRQLAQRLGADQPVEHSPNLQCPVQKLGVIQESSIDSPRDPVLGLVRRTSGDEQEASLVAGHMSSICLGEVGSDGVGGPNQLDAECPPVERPPSYRGFSYVVGEAHRFLVDTELGEVPHAGKRPPSDIPLPLLAGDWGLGTGDCS